MRWKNNIADITKAMKMVIGRRRTENRWYGVEPLRAEEGCRLMRKTAVETASAQKCGARSA